MTYLDLVREGKTDLDLKDKSVIQSGARNKFAMDKMENELEMTREMIAMYLKKMMAMGYLKRTTLSGNAFGKRFGWELTEKGNWFVNNC